MRPLYTTALAALACTAIIGLDAGATPAQASGYHCGYGGCAYYGGYRHHWYRHRNWDTNTYSLRYHYSYPRVYHRGYEHHWHDSYHRSHRHYGW